MKIKPFNTFYFVLALCTLTSFIVICAYYIEFHKEVVSNDSSDWSNLGSYIGGTIGSIFSLTSVILIYMTFKSQQQTTNLQMFETTYFNMLSTQRDLLKTLHGVDLSSNKRLVGDEFIDSFAIELSKKVNYIISSLPENLWQNYINEFYNQVFNPNASTLGHYFRHLYHIVKYTHESEINNKKKYIDIIQAQMSDNELYINFYNAISYKGNKKFLPLLNEYGFFENIQSRGSLFDAHAKQFYPQTMFKNYTQVEEFAGNLEE